MHAIHTPRLCIDGRAALEFPDKGLVAQELIDQLVAANGEEDNSSEWVERRRTVLLSHPEQVFAGQLKRFDTKKKIGKGLLYQLWEREFVKSALISVFHRFRPVDSVSATHKTPTVTTLLPARISLPFFLSRRDHHFYVVPSEADARKLIKSYHIAPEQAFHIIPNVRRYVHFTDAPKTPVEGSILFLIGQDYDPKELKKLLHVVEQRFPGHPIKKVRLEKKIELAAVSWMKMLSQTKAVFYLTAAPFDWGTLALESIFWAVPTIFADNNTALNELMGNSPLRLSNFLIDLKELPELKKLTIAARESVRKTGAFDPYFYAKQYAGIYRKVPLPNGQSITAPLLTKEPEQLPCCDS